MTNEEVQMNEDTKATQPVQESTPQAQDESADYGSYLNDGRSDMEPRRILEFQKERDVDGSERIKSFSKTHERTMKRLEDFTDVYRNAER